MIITDAICASLPEHAVTGFFCLGAGVSWSQCDAQRSGLKFRLAATGSFSCSALHFALLLVVTDDQAEENRLECAFVFGHVCWIVIVALPFTTGDKIKTIELYLKLCEVQEGV